MQNNMEMANYSGSQKHTETLEKQLCSPSLTKGIHEHLIYISTFNICLSMTAFLGNTLILFALRKETSLHPPSKLLLRCLATTDLCVGLFLEPIFIIHLLSVPHKQWNLCRYALRAGYILSYILCSVSLFTMSAISVDRLLALLLGLRYKQVVTLKRAYMIVIFFWVVSFVVATSYLANHQIPIWYGRIVISFCVVTSIVSYSKIFLTLRHHQNQVQAIFQQQQQQQQQLEQKASQASPLNTARYRKAVSSAIWVQLTLVACYSPYGIVGAFSYDTLTPLNNLVLNITITLAYLNSSLNPFLYCWKISEVKQAVKQTIRDAFCCLSS